MRLLILTCFIVLSKASIIDVFEATNGHEPRVAIKCGRVPFYVDLETGAWVEDSESHAVCDDIEDDVKRYCQKMYPKLNITNYVEANKPTKFNNWCKPGESQCTEAAEVTAYRCLVSEYEADALMVPDGCKFDHFHNLDLCLDHDSWKIIAKNQCKDKYHGMKLRDYGILLSCSTHHFTGVEFVCCPPKHHKKDKKGHKKEHKKPHHRHHKHHKNALKQAIDKFLKYLPVQTKGCDRSNYLAKQTAMEDRHRNQIAAVVDEWDEAEKRYNTLKKKDPIAAEEKMKRTLEVFNQTLNALEEESKQEKNRLRTEHADCINTQIAKNKRDAMLNYTNTIQEKPVDAEKILKTVRKFIQVCEHDRVHSLRHFEHVRNRDAQMAEHLREELLTHLKDLNKVVNESMALLNYLPEIAKKFGLTGNTGGAILKPRLQAPKMPVDDHKHEEIEKIMKKVKARIEKNEVDDAEDNTEEEGETELEILNIASVLPTEAPVDPKPYSDPTTKTYGSIKIDSNGLVEETDDGLLEERDNDVDDAEDDDDDDIPEPFVKDTHSRGSKQSPFAINVILGLCCGILVIMLFVVIAMVVRRRRFARTRVILAENNDDREHLVQMQKNGFENPTYKFFYY